MEYKELDVEADPEASDREAEEFDTSLEKRFEVWNQGQLLLRVDIRDDEFVVEWYTRKNVLGFTREVDQMVYPSDAVRVSCMLSEEEGDKYLHDKTLGAIRARNSFPDECTYMEVDPDDATSSVAWAEGTPHPTITMRGKREDVDLLMELAELTIVDQEFSTEEVWDLLDEAVEHVISYLENGPESASLTERLTDRFNNV